MAGCVWLRAPRLLYRGEIVKLIRNILVLLSIFLCQRAMATDPVAAYGVSIVGNTATCAVNVGLRCTNLSAHPYILLGGYYAPGDNGGGYFAMGP
jgi:hypothetical protein